MKQSFWIAFAWILLVVAASCARRGSPTGGPKDSIPPTLVRMYPELEVVNFDDDEIEVEFDEYIEARDLKRELIITPPIEDYSFYISRRTLHLDIEEKLRDSTTYTFNFREAVKDISEKNPAENLIIAFSTGPEIDSLQVTGTVRNLMAQQPVEEAVVALYDVNDTVDVFTGTPMYLAKTDEEGNYIIRYIREGLYNVYAYVDENGNLQVDSNNESFGFKAQPIYLGYDVNQENGLDTAQNKEVNLVIQRQDIRPIQLQSARNNGKYFEFKFNKSLSDYTLTLAEELGSATLDFLQDSIEFNLADTSVTLFSNFQDIQKSIRVYNTLKKDSLAIRLTATDSAQQSLPDTTLYIKFGESRRDFADFTSQFQTKSDEITDTISGTFEFSKPIARINTDSILLSYDTLFYIPIDYEKSISWNKNYDRAKLSIPVLKEQVVDSVIFYSQMNDSLENTRRIQRQRVYLDSLNSDVSLERKTDWLQIFIQDKGIAADRNLLDSIKSLENEEAKQSLISNYLDSVQINQDFPPNNYSREDISESLRAFNFYVSPGSFMSVENDSSVQVIQQYSFKDPEDYGAIRGTISTNYPSYIIQLVNQQFELVREQMNGEQFSFDLVPPGKYQIRILIDADEDGQWEAGSILDNQEPEPVYFYNEEELIDLRANWERSDLNIIIGELSTLSSE